MVPVGTEVPAATELDDWDQPEVVPDLRTHGPSVVIKTEIPLIVPHHIPRGRPARVPRGFVDYRQGRVWPPRVRYYRDLIRRHHVATHAVPVDVSAKQKDAIARDQ